MKKKSPGKYEFNGGNDGSEYSLQTTNVSVNNTNYLKN